MTGPALGRLSAFLAGYRRRRFAWLFVSLLLTFAARSAVTALPPRYDPLELLLALNLVAVIAGVAEDREIGLLVALGIAFLAARSLQAALGISASLAVSEGLWVVTAVVAIVAMLRHALGPGIVDGERILAALDAYLLAGLLFGVCYWVLEMTWPGSFAPVSGHFDLPRAIYFSLVTLTTLGYGDVIPASELARGLAGVEAVSGQMYLAVLVARLVSLYSRQRDD